MELRLKGIELEWGRDTEFHFMEESESTKDFEVRIKNKKNKYYFYVIENLLENVFGKVICLIEKRKSGSFSTFG
jgi:hypothetical protein